MLYKYRKFLYNFAFNPCNEKQLDKSTNNGLRSYTL